MGYEVAQSETLVPDVAGQLPEVSPFADISHAALKVQFYEALLGENGDAAAIGRELTGRLLSHAGYIGDPTAEPLMGDDGRPVLDAETDGELTLADYIYYAAGHHLYALEQILDFLHTTPGEPGYQRGQAAYARYVAGSPSQTGRG